MMVRSTGIEDAHAGCLSTGLNLLLRYGTYTLLGKLMMRESAILRRYPDDSLMYIPDCVEQR